MRKSFITGIVILLPLALTVWIVLFVFNTLTVPFSGFVSGIFDHYHWFKKGFFLLSADQVRQVISQFLVLFSLFFFTVLLGFITRWFFFHTFVQMWDKIVHRIPFVRSIYKTTQDVIKTIFTSDSQSFKQVVLVPFPNKETLGIGLITRENLPSVRASKDGKKGSELIAVFVPTTPNPTSGFLMMFHAEDLIFLDMRIEEAFKYIISCGVISTQFKTITRQEAIELGAKNLPGTEKESE